MCTISFIGRQRGYRLAMNRDESSSRPAGLPPKRIRLDGRGVVCPSEPGGGTWIALNDAGVAFGLINWYSAGAAVQGNSVSRGEVIKALAAQVSADAASPILRVLPLERINPFRLIGIFPGRTEIMEWSWNLKTLNSKTHGWHSRQWISSGYDEPAAQRIRSRTFQLALRQKTAGSLEWLRRLHRSHAPSLGPFSTCMHRQDAATVSYTEIVVFGRHGTMRHWSGSPCRAGISRTRHAEEFCLTSQPDAARKTLGSKSSGT
jgi:hypothetical protein